MNRDDSYEDAVAVIGMAGRFPGAADVEALWRNLLQGEPGIRSVSDRELLDAGVDPALLADPRYVRRTASLDGVADFDAAFFGFTPSEAETTDPQHRLFLECGWEALETAGYRPDRAPGATGVFGGCGFSHYLHQNLFSRPDVMVDLHKLQLAAGNDRDALTTLLSYKLGLSGPSVAVQSFCSTSLVAVHLAVQSLLTFECDMALAGGASIDLPQPSGYLYEQGGIVSPEGIVRSFDARANGTVISNGVGVVLLKRAVEAIRDGDHVHALILGSAMSNDGRDKVGYSAPGAAGQAAAIESAIRVADVDSREIGYVECHATGTLLGDSVELSALRQAFTSVEAESSAQEEAEPPVTVLGSLKPTHGHLDRASGVAGLIRAALAVEHGILPGTPNFTAPNPVLAEAGGRFEVRTENSPWHAGESPRRAGVSSFGLGGTNAHVVLGQAPSPQPRPSRTGPQLLVWSARDHPALDALTARLRDHLDTHSGLDLADVAFTLQQSRTGFAVRRYAVVDSVEDAVKALGDESRWTTATVQRRAPVVDVRLRDAAATSERVWSEAAEALPGLAGADPRMAVLRRLADHGMRIGDCAVEGATPSGMAELVDRSRAGRDLDAARTEDLLRLDVGPRTAEQGGWWLLAEIGRLWVEGVDWDWDLLSDGNRRRVRMPGYPFQRRPHWVDPGTAAPPGGKVSDSGGGREPDRERRDDPKDWFYQPVWNQRPLFAAMEPQRLRELGPWLVFANDPVMLAAAQELRDAGAAVTVARPGAAFTPEAADEFTIRAAAPEDQELLLEREGAPVRTVLHGWGLEPPTTGTDRLSDAERFEAAQERGFHSVRATLRALAGRRSAVPVTMVLVSDGALGTAGTDVHNPEHATLDGLATVIGQEHPDITCRCVDVDATMARRRGSVRAAAVELLTEAGHGAEAAVLYRAGSRWVRAYEPLPVPPVRDGREAIPGPDATVLITGGLGGIGMVLAEHLHRTRRARLVLTAASPLPPRDSWRELLEKGNTDERSLHRIRGLLGLQEEGAQVFAASADAANPEHMARVVAEAEQRYGRVDAVVHAAGVSSPAYFGKAGELTRQQCDAHFNAKVRGFLALREVLEDRPDTALLAFSSLSAVLGGLGFAAYAAANTALDAYAQADRAAGRGRWLTVDWEAWRTSAEQHVAPGTSIADYSMTPEEGLDVFDRAWSLAPTAGHLVVSSGQLDTRIADWVRPVSETDQSGPEEDPDERRGRHPRPPLSTPYEPPENDREQTVANVWSQVLGIDGIGAEDDFFELGGHSLLATQLVGRLSREMSLSIPVITLLEFPTVRRLTEVLDEMDGRGEHRESAATR